MCNDAIVDLYERHAADFDRDRRRSLQEKAWLDAFLSHVPRSGVVADIGCGMGEPIARYLIERGYRLIGVDSSPSMIERCRTRFPQAEWIVADMRQLALGQSVDALLAWDSLFHLSADDQRAMFPRFAAHARPGGPLLFTSGSAHGEAIGCCWGEPLYHASLDPAEYELLLSASGFSVIGHVPDDADCGHHTVWLAQYRAGPRAE